MADHETRQEIRGSDLTASQDGELIERKTQPTREEMVERIIRGLDNMTDVQIQGILSQIISRENPRRDDNS